MVSSQWEEGPVAAFSVFHSSSVVVAQDKSTCGNGVIVTIFSIKI
jgi:hypothetical protein